MAAATIGTGVAAHGSPLASIGVNSASGRPSAQGKATTAQPTVRVNVVQAHQLSGGHHPAHDQHNLVKGFDDLSRRFEKQLELRCNHHAHIVRALTNQQRQIVEMPKHLHTLAQMDAEAAALDDPEAMHEHASPRMDVYNEDLARFRHYHATVLDTLHQPLAPDARHIQKMQAYQADQLNKHRGPEVEDWMPHHDQDGYTDQRAVLGGLRPIRNHDPLLDAKALRRAMRGLGTEERVLSGIIGSRVFSQRRAIAQAFETMYRKHKLYADVQSETSGTYGRMLLALLTDPHEFLAECLHTSMKGLGTDDEILMETLCTQSNFSVRRIKEHYEERYEVPLEHHVQADTSGHYRQLLLAICKAERTDEDTVVDVAKVKEDAYSLLMAGEAKRLGTDESVFIEIFAHRSFAHLRLLALAYAKLDDFDIEKAISRETSGHFCKALLTIMRAAKDSIALHADILDRALADVMFKDHDTLIRVLVSRSEIDLYDIAHAFHERHGQTLLSRIRQRTGGNLRNLILELFGDEQFDPYVEAKKLRKAMAGFGVNKSRINQVVSSRSSRQRRHIREAYESNYNRSLLMDLKSELAGDHRDLVLSLFMLPEELAASELRRAIKRLGTDDETLIDILCSRTGWEIKLLKRAYRSMYGGDIVTEVQNDTMGDYQDLLVALLLTEREDREKPNEEKARELASRLFRAGEDVVGTDEEEIIDVMTRHSFPLLRQTFDIYARMCNYDIEQSIKRECSFHFKKALVAIVQVIRAPTVYFASQLHRAMKGIGTTDRNLIRIVVSRVEIDMAAIETEYFKQYGQTLERAITSETSGNYRRLLLKLLDRARETARHGHAEVTHILAGQ